MELNDYLLNLFKGGFVCLDDQKPFARFFEFSLPAINRRDVRNNIDAGGEASLNQRMCDLAGFFF